MKVIIIMEQQGLTSDTEAGEYGEKERRARAFTDWKRREGKRFYSFLHSFDQSRIDQDGAAVIKDMTDHPRNSPK